jgi:hypothetical protein
MSAGSKRYQMESEYLQRNSDEIPNSPTFLTIRLSLLLVRGGGCFCRLLIHWTIFGVRNVLHKAIMLPDSLAAVVEVNESPIFSKKVIRVAEYAKAVN